MGRKGEVYYLFGGESEWRIEFLFLVMGSFQILIIILNRKEVVIISILFRGIDVIFKEIVKSWNLLFLGNVNGGKGMNKLCRIILVFNIRVRIVLIKI